MPVFLFVVLDDAMPRILWGIVSIAAIAMAALVGLIGYRVVSLLRKESKAE